MFVLVSFLKALGNIYTSRFIIPTTIVINCYWSLQTVFYFYLFGTIFLILESYEGVMELPVTSNMYNLCHYYQVHLPKEAMALIPTRVEEIPCNSEGIWRPHRKDAIHFIVDKKSGKSVIRKQLISVTSSSSYFLNYFLLNIFHSLCKCSLVVDIIFYIFSG